MSHVAKLVKIDLLIASLGCFLAECAVFRDILLYPKFPLSAF